MDKKLKFESNFEISSSDSEPDLQKHSRSVDSIEKEEQNVENFNKKEEKQDSSQENFYSINKLDEEVQQNFEVVQYKQEVKEFKEIDISNVNEQQIIEQQNQVEQEQKDQVEQDVTSTNQENQIQEQSQSLASGQFDQDQNQKQADSFQELNNIQIIDKDLQLEGIRFSVNEKDLKQYRKQSQEQLKKWQDICWQKFANHIQVVEMILERLQKRVKSSKEGIQQIVKYMKEKREIELQYAKFHQKNLQKLVGSFKEVSESSNWGNNCFRLVDEVSDLQSKQILIFAAYIEKNIIKDVLLYEIQEYEVKIKLIQETIQQKINEYLKYKKNYDEISQKHEKLFQDLSSQDGKAKKPDLDLFNMEIKLKRASIERFWAQNQLGKEVNNYWNELKKMEIHRFETIQRTFTNYLQKLNETHPQQPSLQQALEEFEIFSPEKEINLNFSPEVFLSFQEREKIKKFYQENSTLYPQFNFNPNENLSILLTQTYVQGFEIPEMKRYSPLVLMNFHVFRDIDLIKDNFIQNEIIITADDVLLFYDLQKPFSKAEIKLAIKKIKIQKKKEKSEEIYILDKSQSIFSKKISIRFENTIQADNFINYIEQYQNSL